MADLFYRFNLDPHFRRHIEALMAELRYTIYNAHLSYPIMRYTGRDMDKVAGEFGLKRRYRENDQDLRQRVYGYLLKHTEGNGIQKAIVRLRKAVSGV